MEVAQENHPVLDHQESPENSDGVPELNGQPENIISQKSETTLAQNKLKELDELLKDYPEQDLITENGNASKVSDEETGDETKETASQGDPGEDTNNETPIVSTNDAKLSQESESSNKRVVSSDPSDDEDQDLNDLLLTLSNGESYDLTDSNECKKLARLYNDSYEQMEELKKKKAEREQEITEKNGKITKMEAHIKEQHEKNQKLNTKFQELLQELSKSQETLKTHDASARNAITRLQTESDSQIKSLKAKCASMQKEKEASVMNYARREKELLDAKRHAEAADKKSKEAIKEKERVITQMKSMRMDVSKLKTTLEKQETECAQFKKEAEKWKEESNSHIIKVKWAQNKLKSETDAHSETKEKLSKAVLEIKRAKEETEQIRINCQGMIKTYQESEEMRSNSLDSQLKEKEMLLSQQEAKSGELEGIHKQQTEEMRKLKQQYKEVLEEKTDIKTRTDVLEKERAKNEETIKGYTEVLNRQKKEVATLTEKLKELDQIQATVAKKESEVEEMKALLKQQKEYCEELNLKEKAWKEKQQELLEFTQKVSTKNAELTSTNEILKSKLENTSTEFQTSKQLCSGLENEVKSLQSQLNTQSKSSDDLASELSKRLEDKEATLNHLTTRLDESKDEIRTLKRKHTASIKDLTRQLQHARRKLEPYESSTIHSGSGPATEDGSMGSRASSDTSLDFAGRASNGSNITSHSHNSAAESNTLSHNSNGTDVPETVVSSTGEISTQTLVERIVRLQRIHAKKNEKIDFLHDHVQQLVEEMQKKNRIIQHYVLREESGLLMPNPLPQVSANDRTGGKMSRHLTEEVNRKMQSVLEDTLLKNIALKESVDALGSEIARLSARGKT